MFTAKICDFGMATSTRASTMRTAKADTGASRIAYKAPEGYDDDFSTASQVYAFGIVFTGRCPGRAPRDQAHQ